MGICSKSVACEVNRQYRISDMILTGDKISDQTRVKMEKVTAIHLRDVQSGDLKGIDEFPNLETLVISASGDGTGAYVTKPLTDSDMELIRKCKNLKKLSIVKQSGITEIDLNGLAKLESVELCQNSSLKKVRGIDELPELRSVTCLGNENLYSVGNLDKMIVKQSDNLENVDVDTVDVAALTPEKIGSKWGRIKTGFSEYLAYEISCQTGIPKNLLVGHTVRMDNWEKINQITELHLKNYRNLRTDLQGIDKLPHLEKLEMGERVGVTGGFIKDTASLTDDDVELIEKCKNLKELSIFGQRDITTIDLSGLSKLESVEFVQNKGLEQISGIDKLSELRSVTCSGNENLQSVDNLDKMIVKQEAKLEDVELDVLLFSQAIGYNASAVTRGLYKSTEAYNSQAVDSLQRLSYRAGVCWSEPLNKKNAAYLTHSRMVEMHNKACEIMDQNVPKTAGTMDTIVGVELWLAKNVKYDNKGLEDKRCRHEENGKYVGPAYGTNGAYNALMYGAAVCEGYTRAEQYLLALRGIKSYNVLCAALEDKENLANSNAKADFNAMSGNFHSIIRLKDYYNLYSDPCWNACSYQQGDKSMPYTLLTKEEIRKDHLLSYEERNPRGDSKISNSFIADSIKYNNAFVNAVRSGVDKTQDQVGAELRGAVPFRNRIPKVGEYSC